LPATSGSCRTRNTDARFAFASSSKGAGTRVSVKYRTLKPRQPAASCIAEIPNHS
jgi:hypothetical protein